MKGILNLQCKCLLRMLMWPVPTWKQSESIHVVSVGDSIVMDRHSWNIPTCSLICFLIFSFMLKPSKLQSGFRLYS